jgi:hypothetical protein
MLAALQPRIVVLMIASDFIVNRFESKAFFDSIKLAD